MTKSLGEKQKQRPGDKLLGYGIALVVIGVILCIVGLATTHVEIVPGTLRTIETHGSPPPIAWPVMIAGLVLAGIGYRKSRA